MVEFSIKTDAKLAVIAIDRAVEEALAKTKIKEGLVNIFVPHATCGLILNENESRLKQDFLRIFQFIDQLGPFAHDQSDDNASAHILASIFGQSLTLPILHGKISKGTWQNIMLAEFDGPRTRRVIITIV